MSAAPTIRPVAPTTRLAALLAAALLAAVLILAAEGAADESRQRWGLYGYLLLQAAGWLGLWGTRPRASRILGTLFIFNVVFFSILESGILGPRIDLISFSLVLIFFSGVAGGLALLNAISLTVPDLPGQPPQQALRVLVALGIAVVATLIIVLVINWLGDIAAFVGGALTSALIRPGLAQGLSRYIGLIASRGSPGIR